MGIVNKTLDSSEQIEQMQSRHNTVPTGITLVVASIPCAATVQAIQVASFGLSGTPVGQFTVQRFVVGAGATVFELGSTFALRAFGTSGYPTNGISITAGVSSLTSLIAGDVICYTSSGANSAANNIAINVMVKPTDSVRTFFGLV